MKRARLAGVWESIEGGTDLGLFVRFRDQSARTAVTPLAESGPFGVLAVADLDADGKPEIIVQRRLGSLWEIRVAELQVAPRGPRWFHGVSVLGCGELG